MVGMLVNGDPIRRYLGPLDCREAKDETVSQTLDDMVVVDIQTGIP
jgi:hypothetical protein